MTFAREVAASCALLALVTVAPARGEVLSVTQESCGELDVAEVQRILGLELSTLAARTRVPALDVELVCAGPRVRIVLREPQTSKQVEREIPAPSPLDRDRERVIALAASQLVVTSWLEAPANARADSPTPRSPPPPADGGTGPRPQSTSMGPVLDVHAGVRARHFSTAVWLARTGLDAGYGFSRRVTLFVDLAIERGVAERRSGDVVVTSFFGGGGASLRIADLGAVMIDERVTVGASYGRLDGRPRAGFGAASADGLACDLGLGLGPTLRFGALRLGIEANAGASVPGPVGRVVGEAPVAVNGAWAGGAFRLGIDLSRSAATPAPSARANSRRR